MPKVSCTVTVDFSGVRLVGTQFQGTPSWAFSPDPLPVYKGQNNVSWTLVANNLPQGANASFPASNPIVFKPSNPIPWTGGPPTKQSDGTVTASDNFGNLAATEDFFYTVSVVLTQPLIIEQTYSYDPEIENESGG